MRTRYMMLLTNRSLAYSRRQGPPTPEVLLTALHETSPQASALPSLSLRALRDAVLAGDPGCVCDPELFTGPTDIEPENEPPEDRAARINVAREVCASCPVRLACLAYTLRTRPAAGVWAGFTPDEIAALIAAAKRPVRPRRHTALRPASAEPARIAEVA
jgi:WhiB family transcriptional regulator, redox-sensing transcriptional regulator